MTDLTVQTDRSSVPAGGGSVRTGVRIQPGMADDDAIRHVALCIDTSGSMSGEKMERVREGVRWTFGYMAEDDYLSIVTFDDEVEVVLPATRWGDMSLDEAEEYVAEMRPGGGTDILGGLQAAYETLADLPTGPDVGRRILLLSDGRDETETPTFSEFARRVRRDDGIAIPAAGIGEFYDKPTIRAVGTASDGEWVHLSQARDIQNFFGRKVETLRTVVAPSPNLEVNLPQGARVGEVLLRQPQVRAANVERMGDSIRVFLPDLLEFETQEVVFTVEVPGCEAGRSLRLAEVTLNTPGQKNTASVDVDCGTTPSGAGTSDEASETEQAVERPDVAYRHVETMIRKAASEGDLERAETMVKQATGDVETKIRGDTAPGDEQTRIRDDEPAGEQETKIRDDEPAGNESPDTGARSPGDEATKIRRDDEGNSGGAGGTAEPPTDEQTRIRDDSTSDQGESWVSTGEDDVEIRTDRVADLSGVVDDDDLSALETVVRSTGEDDFEDQYETTKIRDREGG